MDAVSLIRKKREGQVLSEGEINFLISGYVGGEIPDYQISSLLMAIFFRGLNFEETGFLTISPGKSTLNMPEKLTFKEISGQGCTVYRNKLSASASQCVSGSGCKLLTSAGFTKY